MTATIDGVLALMRPEILALKAYASARSQFQAASLDDVVLLDANESPYLAPPASQPFNRYPDPQPPRLVRLLAGLWHAAAEQVIVTRGSDDAIDVLMRCFLRPGQDAILIHPPTFAMYQVAATIQGGETVSVPMIPDGDSFRLDIEGLLAAVDQHPVKLVFLCSPNNPTGTHVPRAERLRLIQALAGKAVLVVDEAYAEFTEDGTLAPLVEAHPHLVILRTLSKGAGLAGVRVGGAVAHPQVIERMRAVLPPYPIPRPVEQAVLAALSPMGQLLAQDRVREMVAERQRMADALAAHPDIASIAPSAANFLFLTFTSAQAAAAANARLRHVNIIARHFGGGALDRSWRLSIGTQTENDQVLAALGLIKPVAAPPPRRGEVLRETKETQILVQVDLDQTGPIHHQTGVGFYDHMLDQLAKHGGFSSRITTQGDLHIDGHHTIEDVAIALGQALRQALGDKRGIGRYGFTAAMDESLADCAIDLSGRMAFEWEGTFTAPSVGQFDAEMTPHVFRSLAESLGCALHVRVTGDNTHHMIEGCFKAVGRALRQAFARQGDPAELPSTKGLL